MVQLRERAGHLVKHLEPEDVDDKQGLEKIFAVLEKRNTELIGIASVF